jgi:hypothetical protein
MLICTSCNIKYREDKKYCHFCGNPLVKEEDVPEVPKDKPGEEISEARPICPNCKISYEFGSSCIQCGSALVSQITTQTREDHKIASGPELEVKSFRESTPQTPTPSKNEPEIGTGPQVEEEPFQRQENQESLIKVTRKNLICPNCKILYERGDSCIRCGSALLTQIPSHSTSQPENLGLTSTQVTPISPSKDSGLSDLSKPQVDRLGVNIEKEAFPEMIGQESAAIEEIHKEEPEVVHTRGKAKEEFTQSQLSEPPPIKKLTGDSRRLFLGAVGILVIIVAGGYFIWLIYSHLITKRPEPGVSVSREEISQIHPDSSVSTHPEVFPSEQEKAISLPTPSSLPHSSKTPSNGTQEIENMKKLLENIRQANIKKNIDLFISCYAADFKDREGKKRTTLIHWQDFDYLNLSYELKRPSISGDMAKARVEWLMKISPKIGGQPQESRTILDVTLKKEEGGWKIKEVKPIG